MAPITPPNVAQRLLFSLLAPIYVNMIAFYIS